MQIHAISSNVLGGLGATDPTPKTTHTAPSAPTTDTHTSATQSTTAVPPHATTTIYNAKGQKQTVGAVPSTPHTQH